MYQHVRTQASADAKTHPREMQERQGRSVPQRFLSCLHGMQARDFEDAERCSKASKSPPPFPKGSGDAFPEAPTASPKSIPTSCMAGCRSWNVVRFWSLLIQTPLEARDMACTGGPLLGTI